MTGNRPVRIPSVVFIFVSAALFILFMNADGFSRAGRGQSYHSSSSSSSHSYSSSSHSYSSGFGSSSHSYSGGSSGRSYSGSSHSGGSSSTSVPRGTDNSGSGGSTASSEDPGWFWILVALVIMFGGIGLAIYILVRIIKKISGFVSAAGKPGFDDSAPTQYNFDPAIAGRVRAGDPEFSPEKFMDKAKTISERLQQAWSDGDMMPIRNYVSQGVFNRFRLQLELMIGNEGVRNLMGDFKLLKIKVLALSASKSYQTLHVSINASARDATVPAGATDDEKMKALAGTPKDAFTEVYSFTRKLGAKTNTASDWLKGQCPNCGYVPDNFSESNKCRSCGSIYNSGEFDWVLSEITQEEEWKEDSSRDIEGLAALEGRNLSINREVIEDRASYLFWRWIYARVRGTAAPLARDAAPAFIAAFPARTEKLYNTAVGAVDLMSVTLDGEDAVAKVKILWSTATSLNDEPYHREHLFTLAMPVALKNPYGLADHGCNSCGAPLPETDALKCTYCGSDLPPAVSDWLLVAIDEIDWEKGHRG